MARMIQIRNVPEPVHRRLKARAAMAGKSLSEYLLGELTRGLERPTRVELLERVAQSPPTRLRTPAVKIVRRERDSR